VENGGKEMTCLSFGLAVCSFYEMKCDVWGNRWTDRFGTVQ